MIFYRCFPALREYLHYATIFKVSHFLLVFGRLNITMSVILHAYGHSVWHVTMLDIF